MRLIVVAVALLLPAFCANAQTGVMVPGTESLDGQVIKFMDKWHLTGGSLAISRNGAMVYNKGFGFADEARTIPASPENLYRIASVSKPVTAITIMKLIQDGKISLQDKVFGRGGVLDKPYYSSVIRDQRIYAITIQNLLEHTSGWDRDFPCDGYPHSDPAFFPLHVSATLHEPNPVGDSTLIKFSLLKGLHHQPGSTFSYSNIGYLVLGKVVEQVTGMSYEQYVQDSILHPLGIFNMHLGRNLKDGKLEGETEYISSGSAESCYGTAQRVPCQYGGFNLEAMNSHGGWVATAAELDKLLIALDGAHKNVLQPGTIAVMTEPGKANPNYAKGWFVNKNNNWWHTGSLDGTSSLVCRTSDGYTWTLLFNGRGDNSAAFWNDMDRLPWSCVRSIEPLTTANVAAPAINVSDLTATTAANGELLLSWAQGSGDGRIIVASNDSILRQLPVAGKTYLVSDLTKICITVPFTVVYDGRGNSCNIASDASKKYFFSAFEYYKNGDTCEQPVYQTGQHPLIKVSPALRPAEAVAGP